jgi:hypothetical protein
MKKLFEYEPNKMHACRSIHCRNKQTNKQAKNLSHDTFPKPLAG